MFSCCCCASARADRREIGIERMNQARKRTGTKKVLSMILVLVMLLSLLSMAAFTLPAAASSDGAASNDDSFYRIVHLDCGRKYFSKDWIIALLNEMKADGYNQLQLAFGNDGLRFLLDDMSFEANGIKYSHSDVVSKVEAGNKLQNSSGDASWLTQSQMDEIISTANALGIEIVPLLNLPGHANAILDIADNNTYNAKIYGDVSQNTLDVTNDAACSFGYEIFKKYVDYFSSKGCKYFNFGADEYGNDTGDKNPHFDVLQGTGYEKLSTFINELAAYIGFKNMTPRTFNDALYYKGWDMKTSTNTAIETIQCCYWSSGWGSYPVAPAETIANKGHDMINTNGDYYYVLGKADKFDSDYNYASNFSNSGFMGSTVNSPVGSMFCIWCDFPNAETEQTVAQKVRLPMRAMALRMENQSIANMDESVVTNGFNANGSLNAGSTVTPDTNTQTINVAVNGTATVTVSGTYSGPYTTGDTSIATVTTNTKPTPKELKAVTSIESGKQYLIVNNRNQSMLTSDSSIWQPYYWSKYNCLKLDGTASETSTELWTIRESGSGYEVMRGSNYLAIGENTASVQSSSAVLTLSYNKSGGYWNISQNSYYLNNLGKTVNAGGWKDNAAPTDDGSKWTIYEITGGETATTLTFNGIAEATTSVKIGDVIYTIHVTAEDLSKVTPLTIEYWITNSKMPDANGNTTVSISAASDGVASESGVSVADIVSPTGNKDSRQQEYWQSKLLDKNKVNDSTSGKEEQTTEKGDDETLSGFAFTKVRYWGGAWQVYTTDWVTVKNTDQLVAYYMEIVKITNKNGAENLHVNAADWGTKGDGTGDWGYTPESNRCSVSVQLVYEDGSTSPSATTAAKLNSKTIVYGYWDGGRGLGTMVFNGKDNYQIFKVTAETGDMSSSTSGNTVTVNSFAWDNNEETVWEGAATDSVSIGNPARKPSYDAPYDNLAWNTSEHNKNNAILIRVYVKSIPKAGALTVNYFVQGNADPFYHYGINVVENTTFDAGFKRVEDADAPGKARLINNSVTNYDGEQQEVQSDLSKMTEIGAQYRYSDYTFDKATRSEDGKTVNLYYTFKAEKTFVVDFGLPLVIRPVDVQSGFEGVTFTQVDVTQKSTYANITVDGSGNITYTLNQPIDGEDTFGVKYHGYRGAGSGSDVTYTITVIPATSVYYEDSLAAFTNGTGKAADAKWSIVGNNGSVTEDQSTSKNQALTELSKMSADDVYGHDAAYANSTKLSMGSAHKVTVNANMVKDWSDGSAWPSATFTFKGTGFDVISLTDNKSGAIFVDVYAGKEATGTPVKRLTVNNYYGYKQDGNKWVVDADSSNALYQIPVMKVSGLDYGEYTAVIRVAYSKFFDTANKNQYSFWLDAIRVYDPMGKDNVTYTQDKEGYPQYIKLRDQLAKENGPVTTNNNLLFIDGADKAAIATYANYGPNNEVYLANGQAITFTVPKNAKIASIQIGAKAPNGSAAKMVVNGTETNITSATEMYYEIGTEGRNFTIANNGNGILSLTNLKITFKDKQDSTIALTAPTADEQTAAVMSVRALFAAPEQTFEPERFTAKWSRNVRKGGTATLTVKASEDVESITVDGQTITTYDTKTERTGWGWWAKTVTYREFTYQVAAEETTDYPIRAVNSAGVSSDPITATLTVRPSVRDWWHGIFDKWF